MLEQLHSSSPKNLVAGGRQIDSINGLQHLPINVFVSSECVSQKIGPRCSQCCRHGNQISIVTSLISIASIFFICLFVYVRVQGTTQHIYLSVFSFCRSDLVWCVFVAKQLALANFFLHKFFGVDDEYVTNPS